MDEARSRYGLVLAKSESGGSDEILELDELK